MSTGALAATDQAGSCAESDVPTLPIWRLSVDQFHEMIRAGIIAEDAPVELLDGFLVPKMTKNPPHNVAIELLVEQLNAAVSAGWFTKSEKPITLATSEPEPDATIVRGSRRDYIARNPGADQVALVVEVADTSLARDRGPKKRLYAGAGIPVYWLLNLNDRALEVYTEPTGGGREADYRTRRDHGPGESAPLIIDGTEVARITVREILP